MDQPQEAPPQRPSRAVVLAREVVAELGPEERVALYRWAQELVAIRSARASRTRKALAAIRATTRRDTIVALIRKMRIPIQKAGYKSKQLLWDDRNWPARLALSGVTMGLVAGGPGAGAGVAALGGAVGSALDPHRGGRRLPGNVGRGAQATPVQGRRDHRGERELGGVGPAPHRRW
jgi:hypothetical protein